MEHIEDSLLHVQEIVAFISTAEHGKHRLVVQEKYLLFIQTEGDISDSSVGNIFTLGSYMKTAGSHENRVVLAGPLAIGVERKWLGLDRR